MMMSCHQICVFCALVKLLVGSIAIEWAQNANDARIKSVSIARPSARSFVLFFAQFGMRDRNNNNKRQSVCCSTVAALFARTHALGDQPRRTASPSGGRRHSLTTFGRNQWRPKSDPCRQLVLARLFKCDQGELLLGTRRKSLELTSWLQRATKMRGRKSGGRDEAD